MLPQHRAPNPLRRCPYHTSCREAAKLASPCSRPGPQVLNTHEPSVLEASGFVFINMALRQNTVKRLDNQEGFEHLGNKLTYGVGHANDTGERVWLLH